MGVTAAWSCMGISSSDSSCILLRQCGTRMPIVLVSLPSVWCIEYGQRACKSPCCPCENFCCDCLFGQDQRDCVEYHRRQDGEQTCEHEEPLGNDSERRIRLRENRASRNVDGTPDELRSCRYGLRAASELECVRRMTEWTCLKTTKGQY